jgi:hypothetical protein
VTDQVNYGPVNKIEAQVPNTTIWSRMNIAGEGDKPVAQVLGSWSSGTPDGTITQTIVGVHDSTSERASQWPLYLESWALAGSHPNGTCFSEFAIINQRGSCADIDPYHVGNPGQLECLRLGVGKPGWPATGEVSAYEVFLNVEGTQTSVARLGQVWHDAAVKFKNGVARIINFARNHSLQWWNQWGQETSRIYCSTNEQQWGVQIELGEGSIHFKNAEGVHQFTFNCHTGALYLGAGALGPNGTIRMYVAGRPFLIKATPE